MKPINEEDISTTLNLISRRSDQTRTEYKRDVAGPYEIWRDLSTRLNTHNVGRNGKYRVAKRQDLREEIEVTKQPL